MNTLCKPWSTLAESRVLKHWGTSSGFGTRETWVQIPALPVVPVLSLLCAFISTAPQRLKWPLTPMLPPLLTDIYSFKKTHLEGYLSRTLSIIPSDQAGVFLWTPKLSHALSVHALISYVKMSTVPTGLWIAEVRDCVLFIVVLCA